MFFDKNLLLVLKRTLCKHFRLLLCKKIMKCFHFFFGDAFFKGLATFDVFFGDLGFFAAAVLTVFFVLLVALADEAFVDLPWMVFFLSTVVLGFADDFFNVPAADADFFLGDEAGLAAPFDFAVFDFAFAAGVLAVLAFPAETPLSPPLCLAFAASLNEPEAPLPFVWISVPAWTADFKYFLMNVDIFSASIL